MSKGFRAVALELDDFDNASRWGAFRSAMLAAGVKPGPWYTSGDVSATPGDAAFTIGEVEGAADYDRLRASMGAIPAGMPRALVTTFDGLLVTNGGVVDVPASRARCKPLVDAGFWLQYEAYFMAAPDNTAADQCGFPANRVAPVLGVGFNGRTLEQQSALQVPGWGVYLAEYL